MQNTYKQTQQSTKWLVQQFNTIATHMGTLNLLPQYRTQAGAEQVCAKFIYKLNIAIFGRNSFERSGNRIAVFPVIHNREYVDNCHMHFAFGKLPTRLDEATILRKMYTVAQHTTGVEFVRKEYLQDERMHWTFNNEQIAVHFDKIDNTEAWLGYMTKHVWKTNDGGDTVLLQHIDM